MQRFINNKAFPDVMLLIAAITGGLAFYYESWALSPIAVITFFRGLGAHMARSPYNPDDPYGW